MISLHGRSSPQSSPSSTPCLQKSLSVEAQPEELQERMLRPMHYARSGLGTAELDGKLIAAGTNTKAKPSGKTFLTFYKMIRLFFIRVRYSLRSLFTSLLMPIQVATTEKSA